MAASPTRTERGAIDPWRMARRAALWALVVLFLVAVVLPAIGVEDLRTHLARLDPALIAALLGLSLVNYGLRSLRWQALSAAVGLRVPLLRNALYYVAGFAFAVTPGKVGEVIRLWLLRRHHGAPYERTLGLLVVDRVTDALPLLALCLPGALAFAGQGWAVAGIAAFLLLVMAFLLRPAWPAAAVKLAYGRVRRRPRLFARALRSLRPLRSLTAPRVLLVAFALGLAGWSAEVLATWLLLDRLGAEVGLAAAAFVFGFGMLVGGLPIFPGGVGGSEATMIGLLLLLGVDVGTAVTATAVIRLTTLGFAVVLGFAALPFAVAAPRGGGPPLPATAAPGPLVR
jgi:glycosyltransferase 2 family protein